MNWFDRAGKATILTLALSTLFLTPNASAQAQSSTQTTAATPQPKEADNDQGWNLGITPYIWFAGIHGTVGALDHDASVHATFGDIFNYFNIGLMGVVEPRYNRIVMPVDFMWMKLSDNQALPLQDEAESVKAKLNETIITPKIGYRFVDTKKVKVDALFGFRYWHLGTTLTLQPTELQTGFSQSANWVDGLGGGRIELALTPKLSAMIAGDAGGGSARLDYQVGGGLGYKLSRRWVLVAGYRYLVVDYRPRGNLGFVYDVAMPGVMVGATFNIK